MPRPRNSCQPITAPTSAVTTSAAAMTSGIGALLLQEAEVALHAGALKPGGQDGAAAVHGAHQQHEDIEILSSSG